MRKTLTRTLIPLFPAVRCPITYAKPLSNSSNPSNPNPDPHHHMHYPSYSPDLPLMQSLALPLADGHDLR